MTFPAINISTKKWSIEDSEEYAYEYILYDDYIRSNDESYFIKYYKNHLFCDAKGTIYKVVSKAAMTQKWRNWLRIIPGVWKTKMLFKDTHQKMSMEELRTYMLEHISELDDNEIFLELREAIKKAKSFKELITG